MALYKHWHDRRSHNLDQHVTDVLGALSLGIASVDQGGAIRMMNRAAEELTGWSMRCRHFLNSWSERAFQPLDPTNEIPANHRDFPHHTGRVLSPSVGRGEAPASAPDLQKQLPFLPKVQGLNEGNLRAIVQQLNWSEQRRMLLKFMAR